MIRPYHHVAWRSSIEAAHSSAPRPIPMPLSAASPAGLEQLAEEDRGDQRDDQRQQPDRRFEERELRPVEVEAEVAGGQRAGQ